jgi:GAF domain-containing protein
MRSVRDRNSLETIQAGILKTMVDKARELLSESREHILSANLMVAVDTKRMLRIKTYSSTPLGRNRSDVRYDAPGAGRAISTMQPVYIPDIKSSDLKGHFREDAPYRSILSIPIGVDGKRLGVVNIDSTEEDHLQLEWLVDHLQPYVQLLGLSLCIENSGNGGIKDGANPER